MGDCVGMKPGHGRGRWASVGTGRARGWLISLEGGEGTGKSTHLPVVVQFLSDRGYRCRVVREPGGTALGERLRNLLLGGDPAADAAPPAGPLAEVLLFAASRAQLVDEVILPALHAGEVVVCDRYVDSSVAYQGFGLGLGPDVVWTINRIATRGLLPDLTLLFDCPPEVACRRRPRPRDRLELRDQEFHRRVRAGYLSLARQQPWRFVIIDATEPVDRVTAAVRTIVGERLGLRP